MDETAVDIELTSVDDDGEYWHPVGSCEGKCGGTGTGECYCGSDCLKFLVKNLPCSTKFSLKTFIRFVAMIYTF